jgi:two-component system nitrate/nitrite response regulator NarL
MVASPSSQAADPIRVAVVSKTRAVREALTVLLERDGEVVVDYQSDATLASIASLSNRAFDVVLADGACDDCLAALPDIRARLPRAAIVVYGVQPVAEVLLMCARSSTTVVASPEADVGTLVALMKDAASGHLRGQARVNAALLQGLAALEHGDVGSWKMTLTRREREIALVLAEGLTNKEIAQRLHISLPTVKSHVHCILRKLGVERRDQVFGRLRDSLDLDRFSILSQSP